MGAEIRRHMRGQRRILLETAGIVPLAALIAALWHFLALEQSQWHTLPVIFLDWLMFWAMFLLPVGILLSLQLGSFPAMSFGCSRRAAFLGDQLNKLLMTGGCTAVLLFCGWLRSLLQKNPQTGLSGAGMLFLLLLCAATILEGYGRICMRMPRQFAAVLLGLFGGMIGGFAGYASASDPQGFLHFTAKLQSLRDNPVAALIVAAVLLLLVGGNWLLWRRATVNR